MAAGPLSESRTEGAAQRGIQKGAAEGERQPREDHGEGEPNDGNIASVSPEESAPVSP
jgi:hypothetical protein